jgi:diaminohydroxyphosphoribosylaminopyrimidine deaminase / 5-amino-6-(5-phosphoribosylamino)uracil reductase
LALLARLIQVAKTGETLTPIQAMSLAIQVADAGAGFVSPNPLVGCVIVDAKQRLLSSGFHARFGAAHAEVDAVQKVANPTDLVGATVYVTLEPCAHFGKTPPCASFLADTPIARVVYGLLDPNPLVAGKGIEILKARGKIVEKMQGLDNELEDLAEVFLFNQRNRRAFIAVKVASTLDGQIAVKNGESRWISGEESREVVQELRGRYDGIMVGKRTFLTDDPKLNCRLPQYERQKKTVFIFDPSGEASHRLAASQLAQCHAAENIVWVTQKNADVASGTRVLRLDALGESFDFAQFAAQALAEGVASILVEGGASLIGQMLEQQSVQRWNQFIAPDLLGQNGALSLGAGWGTGVFARRLRLDRPRWRQLGRDILVSGRLG